MPGSQGSIDHASDVPAPDLSPPGRTRRSWWVAAAAVVLAPILDNLAAIAQLVHYEPRALLSYGTIVTSRGFVPAPPFDDPYVGFVSQALGHTAALDWLHGHVPWWNLNEGLGMPLAGSAQAAAFFPPTLLQALPQGSLWFHLTLEITAGVACLLLLRELRCSPFAAAVGAIAFGLDGSLAWLTNAVTNPLPFLPMCLLGVEYVVRSAGARRQGGWIVLAGGIALSIVAGFPEVAAINLGLVAAWFALRLVQQRQVALGILARAALAAVVGALIAAPMINAFLPYLTNGYVGPHTQVLAARVLPTAGVAQLVAPYLFGSRFVVGGYAGVLLVVLSVASLFGRRERALRLVLAGWATLFVGSAFGLPVLHQVVENLPGVTHIAIYRYAIPSSLFALCVLAALCLDDLVALRARDAVRRVIPGVVVAVALFAIGILSTPFRWGFVHQTRWYWVSPALFALTIGAVGLVVALVQVKSRPAATRLLGALLVLETLGLFSASILSWPRAVSYDSKVVAYLAAHLGTQRYYTVEPIGPDYGSFYGIASLDAADLPVPQEWASYVHSRLNPWVTPSEFGNQGPPGVGTLLRGALEYLANYQASAVKYLVVPTGAHFDGNVQPRRGVGPPTLDGGATIRITYRPPAYLAGSVLRGFSIPLPQGAPPGTSVTACSGARCEVGTLVATTSPRSTVTLASPLALSSKLAITLASSPTSPIAIVTLPSTPASPVVVTADGVVLRRRDVQLTFDYAATSIPRLVATTPTARIYLLAHPAPIASAPGCTVVASSMTSFSARCARPSVLTYRELSYEGWHATVAGRSVPVVTVDHAFQSVPLPQGRSSIIFSYEPPNAVVAWIAALLGLLAVATGLALRRWPVTRRGAGPTSPTEEPASVDEPAP